MFNQELLRAGIVIMAVGFSACTSLPETSRTSNVHNVKVEMGLAPESVSVAPGDEIQWINSQKRPVYVEIPDLRAKDLSCQKGFKNWVGNIRESVRVPPNDSVSLCFKRPGTVLYNVRSKTTGREEKQVYSGSIEIKNRPAR
jgi:plastocyanin